LDGASTVLETANAVAPQLSIALLRETIEVGLNSMSELVDLCRHVELTPPVLLELNTVTLSNPFMQCAAVMTI
jgi:hypothetical protein